MSNKLRTGFAGTPEFAATILESMLNAGYKPRVVYTQPDRRAGRGRQTRPGPVKQLALDHGIAVAQPLSLRDEAAIRTLADHRLDVLVVAAYGLILPAAALQAPRHGCINVHASALPRWRGASPIQAAIAHRDATTGVTIMQMDEGLDTGGIIRMESSPITPSDTTASLQERLAELGGRLLVAVLDRLACGDPLEATPQPDHGALYAGRITKADGWLDTRLPAAELAARVRAFQPWPVAFVVLGNERLRVFEATALETMAGAEGAEPGTVLASGRDGIDIACSEGVLRLVQVQRPGGRQVGAADYLQGRPVAPGTCLEPLS